MEIKNFYDALKLAAALGNEKAKVLNDVMSGNIGNTFSKTEIPLFVLLAVFTRIVQRFLYSRRARPNYEVSFRYRRLRCGVKPSFVQLYSRQGANRSYLLFIEQINT